MMEFELARARAGFLVTLVAAGIVTPILYTAGYWHFNYPDRVRYPVRGIDVSHHQGNIGWGAVAKNTSFVFIKASEGGDHLDSRFEENWRDAMHVGLSAGAYHFFTFCRDGAVQAENFLQVLNRVEDLMLPPAVDLEFKGNCARRPSVKELRAEVLRFAEIVEQRTGVPLVYYVTPGFMRIYRQVLPDGCILWVRSVFRHPGRRFGKSWLYWQYADRDRIPGIKGPVDLDLFNGTLGELRARRLRLRLK